MLTLKRLLWSLIVLAITAAPLMAGSDDAKPKEGNAVNATEAAAAAASPSPAPA